MQNTPETDVVNSENATPVTSSADLAKIKQNSAHLLHICSHVIDKLRLEHDTTVRQCMVDAVGTCVRNLNDEFIKFTPDQYKGQGGAVAIIEAALWKAVHASKDGEYLYHRIRSAPNYKTGKDYSYITERCSRDVAREKTKQYMKAAIAASGQVSLIQSDTGAGKTTAWLFLVALVGGCHMAVVPRLSSAEGLIKEAGEWEETKHLTFNKVLAFNAEDDDGKPICKRPDELKLTQDNQWNIKLTLCGQTGGKCCPHNATCPIMQSRRTEADIHIVTHAMLTNESTLEKPIDAEGYVTSKQKIVSALYDENITASCIQPDLRSNEEPDLTYHFTLTDNGCGALGELAESTASNINIHLAAVEHELLDEEDHDPTPINPHDDVPYDQPLTMDLISMADFTPIEVVDAKGNIKSVAPIETVAGSAKFKQAGMIREITPLSTLLARRKVVDRLKASKIEHYSQDVKKATKWIVPFWLEAIANGNLANIRMQLFRKDGKLQRRLVFARVKPINKSWTNENTAHIICDATPEHPAILKSIFGSDIIVNEPVLIEPPKNTKVMVVHGAPTSLGKQTDPHNVTKKRRTLADGKVKVTNHTVRKNSKNVVGLWNLIVALTTGKEKSLVVTNKKSAERNIAWAKGGKRETGTQPLQYAGKVAFRNFGALRGSNKYARADMAIGINTTNIKDTILRAKCRIATGREPKALYNDRLKRLLTTKDGQLVNVYGYENEVLDTCMRVAATGTIMQDVVGRVLRHKEGVEGQTIVIFADAWLDYPDVEYYDFEAFKLLTGGTGPLASLVNNGLVPAHGDVKKHYPKIALPPRLIKSNMRHLAIALPTRFVKCQYREIGSTARYSVGYYDHTKFESLEAAFRETGGPVGNSTHYAFK